MFSPDLLGFFDSESVLVDLLDLFEGESRWFWVAEEDEYEAGLKVLSAPSQESDLTTVATYSTDTSVQTKSRSRSDRVHQSKEGG